MNALRRLLTATCVCTHHGHAVVHTDKLDAAIVAYDRDLALLDRYETDLARRDGITPAQLRARYTDASAPRPTTRATTDTNAGRRQP